MGFVVFHFVAHDHRIHHLRDGDHRRDQRVETSLNRLVIGYLLLRVTFQQRAINHLVELFVVKTGTPALEVGESRFIAVVRVIDQRAQAGVRMRLHPAAPATDQHVELTFAHRAVDLVAGTGDDFGVDPRLHQRRLNGNGDIEERLVREHAQGGIKTVRVARFRQQLFRLREIKAVTRIRQRRRHARLDWPLVQYAVTRHQRFVNPLIINQVAYRLTYLRVGEVRLFHAHRHVVHGAALHRVDGKLRIFAQGVDIGYRHIVGNIEVAFFNHQTQGLRFLEMAQHHAAHLRLAPPVVRVTLHAQHVFGLPGLQHKRPGTGFVRGQPLVAPVVILFMALHGFAVEHAEVTERAERVNHQLRIVRLWQHNLHRIVVQRGHLLIDVLFAEAVRLPHRRLCEV